MALKKKKNATKPSTSKGSKRQNTANQKASGSATKIKYDPESPFLENRDKGYCQNINVSVLPAAPFDMTCNVFEPYREEETPVACEYPQNLMHLLPSLEEDSDDDDDGHTYNYNHTDKTGYFNFQCIKRPKTLHINLILKGCYFHFAQATIRKVVEYKLENHYFVRKKKGGAKLFIKWLLVLVLLPKELIEPTFNELLQKVKLSKCKKLEKLFKYYYDNWIHGNNWDLDDICQWGCSVRTNNNAERFHMKLNGSVQKTNENFYDLINILGDFALRATCDAKIFALNLVADQKKKKTIKFEEVLLDSCGKLQRKEISNFQFLNNLTSAKHDNPLVDESWGVNFSRIDVMPEDDGYEPENEDSTGSERVYSSEDSSNEFV